VTTNPFHGFQLIESLHMVETYQYRFPRSKKRRIKNKWKKRPINFKTRPRKDFLQLGNKLICHPVMADRFRFEMMATGNVFLKNK